MLIYRALFVESLERPMETLAQGLKKSEEKYRNIVIVLPDLLFCKEMNRRIILKHIGASPEQQLPATPESCLSGRMNDFE